MAQGLLDRLDESIGMEEHDLGRDISDAAMQRGISPVEMRAQIIKQMLEAEGRTISDEDLALIATGEISLSDVMGRTLSDMDQVQAMAADSGRTLSDTDLAIGRTISDQDQQNEFLPRRVSGFRNHLQDVLAESGTTISDADRDFLQNLIASPVDPNTLSDRDKQILNDIKLGRTPSNSDAAILETMQLPPAMELAKMGLGLGSRKTSPLQEDLGSFGFQPHQLPTPERLSPYEEMLMLLSLGIPGAALGGRAVGGLMRGMKGRGIPARNEEALEKILNAPSAMRDMGPQAGNITGGAIALEKLGRPISGNITAGARGLHPFRSYAGDTARKGLESLRKYHPRMPKILSKEQDTAYRLGIDSAKNLKLNQKILKRYEELAPKIANQLKKENANLGKIVNSSEGQKFEALARYKEYIEAGAPFDISPSDLKWLLK